jgi:peptidoglycan/LPS O-acetylase OafA/YrhL
LPQGRSSPKRSKTVFESPADNALSATESKNSVLAHIGYLDGWRGLAILLVLQSHFFPTVYFDSGPFGVNIFFCLSGLLMSELLYVKRVPLASFYRRRVSRILPAFFVFVIVVYGWAYLAGNSRPWSEFFSTLFFLRSYLPEVPGLWQVNLPISHLWSLNVEEHCYLIMSGLILIALIRGREALMLIGAGLLTFVIHAAYVALPRFAPPNYNIHTEIVASSILFSAGYCLLRHRVVRWVRPWMPVAAFFLAVTCYWSRTPTWTWSVLSPLLLAFTVNHLSEAPQFVRNVLSVRALRWFGVWSYSLYLWQQPFANYHSRIVGGSAVAIAATMVVGLSSYYFLENPVRTWLNSWWGAASPQRRALPLSGDVREQS